MLLPCYYIKLRGRGFPGGSDGKEPARKAGDLGFNPWVGKIPWRRAWKPTPVLLPGESSWTEESGRLRQSMGSQSGTTERLNTGVKAALGRRQRW